MMIQLETEGIGGNSEKKKSRMENKDEIFRDL